MTSVIAASASNPPVPIQPSEPPDPGASPETIIDLYRPAEVTRRLGVDDGAVIDLVNAGELPAYRVGGAVRFRRSDVDALRTRLVP